MRLDNPIKINAGKELKIAVKIFDYDERQWPLTYQNGMKSFVKNRSDLYSQDGGKTWHSLDDFYKTIEGQEESGKAAWEIVGNITDNPDDHIESYIDPDLFGYSVYKNGENITRLFAWWQSPFLFTEMPQPGDKFQVYGFHKDGRLISSDEYTFNGVSSVNEISGARQDISFDKASGNVSFGPDIISAELYDMQGCKKAQSVSGTISTSGLTHGVYVVTYRYADGTTGTTKIIK